MNQKFLNLLAASETLTQTSSNPPMLKLGAVGVEPQFRLGFQLITGSFKTEAFTQKELEGLLDDFYSGIASAELYLNGEEVFQLIHLLELGLSWILQAQEILSQHQTPWLTDKPIEN